MTELAFRHEATIELDDTPPSPLILGSLAFATVAVAFCVSAFALVRFGVNYAEAGGSLAAKIHPATYMLAMTLGLRIVLQPRPLRFLAGAAGEHRGAAIFLWILVTLLGYVVLNLHVPLSSLIDTFLFPIMMLLLLEGIDERNARRLALLIHAIFAVNGVLALVEMASGWRLTPIIVEGIDLSAIDRRSSALFGHPLGNAMLTGLYVVALSVGGGRDLPHWLRPAALLLQLAAMVSFGGRLATVAMLGLCAILALRMTASILAGRRFRASSAAFALGLLPLLIVGLVGAYEAGFFDQLLERFVSDNRSTESRVIMFELMGRFPLFQLLFGPDQDLLNSMMWTEGTEFGIESFWVSFILTYGLVPSLLFFIGLGAFLFDLSRHAGKGALWTVAYFLIVASGSLSIGGKTLALGALVMVDLILLRAPSPALPELAWPRRAR